MECVCFNFPDSGEPTTRARVHFCFRLPLGGCAQWGWWSEGLSLSLSSRSEKKKRETQESKTHQGPSVGGRGNGDLPKTTRKTRPIFLSEKRENKLHYSLYHEIWMSNTSPHTAQTPKQSSDVISTLFFLKRISKQFEKWFLKELQGYIASGFFMYDMCCYNSVGASFFPFVCIIPNLLPRQIILLPYKTLDLHHWQVVSFRVGGWKCL